MLVFIPYWDSVLLAKYVKTELKSLREGMGIKA
jgi:hypothetical protein